MLLEQLEHLDTNYIVVDENNIIVGLAFKNISINEMKVLRDAKVI